MADADPAATPFTTAADVLARARATGGDGMLVAPTSAQQFRAVEALRDRRDAKLRLLYRADLALLVATVPTERHEQLHGELSSSLAYCIYDMGLRRSWSQSVGAATFRSARDTGSSGEGDSSGKPWSTQHGNRRWPTLVVQAGETQALASLRIKKDFWFEDSQHQVKIVILAKGYVDQKRILVEQWQERGVHGRPGATATHGHAAAGQDSVCLQTISIVWAGPVPFHDAGVEAQLDHQNYSVTGGPLRLDFASLFLRQPAPERGDHDVVLEDSELQWYATRVWQGVD